MDEFEGLSLTTLNNMMSDYREYATVLQTTKIDFPSDEKLQKGIDLCHAKIERLQLAINELSS